MVHKIIVFMPNTLHLAYVLNQLAFVRVAAMFWATREMLYKYIIL